MAADFLVPDGQLETERDRFAVNAVRAPDHNGVAMLQRPFLQHVEQRIQILQNEVQRLGHLDGQGGIHDVGRGQTHMEKSRIRSRGIRERFQKGDDVVLGDLLDLRDPFRIDPRGAAEAGGDAARHLTGAFQRFAGPQLDFQPDLVLVREIPDGLHARQSVAVNHLLPVARIS